MSGSSGMKRSPIPPQVRVLNVDDIKGGTKPHGDKTVLDLSKAIQQLMLRMKGEIIAEDGSSVRYQDVVKSKLFTQFKEQILALKFISLDLLSEKERMAFFINIYNALTIHGLASCEKIPDSVLNVQLFWKSTAYNIAGHVYTLDDIEHGILRSNRPHPASKANPFKPDDPRLKFIMPKLDPRIHFALNCGAKSCPAIQVYSGANIDSALTAATKAFCAQEVTVYTQGKTIMVSRLFQWYRCDFGTNDVEAVRWTLPYIEDSKRKNLELLLQLLETQGGVDLSYREYDWNLNIQRDTEPFVFEDLEPPPVDDPPPCPIKI